MSQGIEETICRFPYLSLHIVDFNADNNFMDSKNEALRPLEDSLDEFDMFDELRRIETRNSIYQINSNVFLISNRSYTKSNLSNNQSVDKLKF